MAEYFTKLDDLNKNRIDWKIQVCCCRKWQVPVRGSFSESLELLLVDKFGYIIDRFMDLIEGGLYHIEQFSVVDRPKNFPVAMHPYKISFHKNTYIGPTVSIRFPKTVFSFLSYSDIKSGSSKDDAPLMKEDVAVKGNRNINILLEDLKKTKLQRVLWDPYCHQVQNVIEKLKNTHGGYHVVIIQLCRAKIMRGEIGVSNTFYATKVVVDQQVEEIVEYISKLPDNDSNKIYSGSQLSNSSVLSVKEELQYASWVFMTLEELKSSDVAVKVWVTCSVSDVLFEKNCAVFILWDDIARMLIGTSASNVCERLALVLDFLSRPYKDIVQDNDWDPEPSYFDEEVK
ncbi:hypothetical protein OROMI_033722 [Orobanche minor]